ncbi:hypothetical protein ACVIJ6_004195 [Bradyrhizobium sp. USDA 4369]
MLTDHLIGRPPAVSGWVVMALDARLPAFVPVLRTASARISRSSAFVLGGSRVMDGCQSAIDRYVGTSEID